MHWALLILAILTISTPSFAQPADYPQSSFEGVPVLGTAPVTRGNSDPYGQMIVNSPDGGWRTLSLATSASDAPFVRFKYICTIKDQKDVEQTPPTRENGQPCVELPRSKWITSIMIDLDGPQKDNYNLTVKCRVDYFGNNPPSHYTAGPGQYCGLPAGQGAPEKWLTMLDITLARK